MSVATIWKATFIDERADVSEVTGNFLRDHVPELHLPNPWCIDQMTFSIERLIFIDVVVGIFGSHRKRNQLRGCCRVSPFLIFRTDIADSQLQARFNRIEDRTFANTALPCDDTVAPMHDAAQFLGPAP